MKYSRCERDWLLADSVLYCWYSTEREVINIPVIKTLIFSQLGLITPYSPEGSTRSPRFRKCSALFCHKDMREPWNRSCPYIEVKNYAIKNQLKAPKAPTIFLPFAGVLTQWSKPIRAQYPYWSWPMRVLHSGFNYSPLKTPQWVEETDGVGGEEGLETLVELVK